MHRRPRLPVQGLAGPANEERAPGIASAPALDIPMDFSLCKNNSLSFIGKTTR